MWEGAGEAIIRNMKTGVFARRGSSVRGTPPEESESGIIRGGHSFQGPVEGLG